jgi:hypothetical protein
MESRRRFVFFSISLVILFILLILTSSIDLGLQAQAATTDKKSADVAAQSKKFLTYENSNYGIKIQYPSNWIAADKIGEALDTTFIKVGELSLLHSNASSTPVARVGLLIDDLSSQKNLDQTGYVNTIIDAYMKGYQDFRVLGINTTTLAGQAAYSISATYGSQQKIMEIGTVIGDKVFFVQYVAEEPNFSVYLPIVQKMINSLQLDSSQIRIANFPSIQAKLSGLTQLNDANQPSGQMLSSLSASGPALLEDLRRR